MVFFVLAIVFGIAALIAAVVALGVPRSQVGWPLSAGGGLLVVGIVFLAFSVIKTVDTGHVGVRVVFNDVRHDGVLSQGWHLQPPWVQVKTMNIRTQKFDMTQGSLDFDQEGSGPIVVLSRDAGQLTIDATVNFRLDPSAASRVYETLGPAYANVIFIGAVRAALRDAATGYIAVEAATTKREALAIDFSDQLSGRVESRGIIVERVNVRSIDPSNRLKAAIDEKLATQQEVERADFRKAQAEKDAEIRRVEAAGIRDAQEIIRETLSEQYLRWNYQQVLRELIGSPNNTVVVMPQDQSLTPLINIGN